jgi:pantoate--beta-alanine ligase
MSLRIVRTVAELRAELEPARRAGQRIGLVPTMGAFHAGHRSLMERAAGTCDVVVVSLFVNPTQFAPTDDLTAYPRDEGRDAEIAGAAGVDILFAPPVEEVYPDGFATSVSVRGLTDGLEGAHRPGHFDGVATVVAKLLNMVQPAVAFFGQKDAQQALVVRQLVRDLNLPVRIEVCPTVRESDGLAMSSRNVYLGAGDRRRAIGLRRALDAAEHAIAGGERDPDRVAEIGRAVLADHGIEPEYFALVSERTLAPVQWIDGDVLLAVAARVGPARLIDNTLVTISNGVPERA